MEMYAYRNPIVAVDICRSLKLWMVMRMYGSTGLRAYIRNHCDLAKHFEELLQADSRFEVVTVNSFTSIKIVS